MSTSKNDAAETAFGNITTPVMSATKDPVDELGISIRSLSFPQKDDENSLLASPPQSPYEKSNTSNSNSGLGSELRVEASPSVLPTPPTTPQKEPKKLVSEKQLQNIPNFTTLSVQLGLDSWKCGCLKPSGETCKMRIPKRKRFDIELQIRSMVLLNKSSDELQCELDKSSDELQCELEKLISLVHCRHHKEDDQICFRRIAAWKATFPAKNSASSENNKNNADLLVELDIRRILGGVVAHCADDPNFKGPPKDRCQLRGGQRVQNCTKTIDRIVKPEVYLNGASLDYHLRVLERNRYCDSHLVDQHCELVASWKSDIFDVVKTPSLGLPKMSPFPILSEDPAKFWPDAFDSHTFVPIYCLNERRPPEDLIKEKLKEKLNSTEQNDGCVYVMTEKANNGYVKIGYTTRTGKERAEELRWGCNRDITVHYAPSDKIPRAKRVESLCHAELDQHNIEFYCHGCFRNHTEWFKVSAEEAVAVVKKWSAWAKAKYGS
jgi:predicted Fe-S protein YdhL (DUF1289 family)